MAQCYAALERSRAAKRIWNIHATLSSRFGRNHSMNSPFGLMINPLTLFKLTWTGVACQYCGLQMVLNHPCVLHEHLCAHLQGILIVLANFFDYVKVAQPLLSSPKAAQTVRSEQLG